MQKLKTEIESGTDFAEVASKNPICSRMCKGPLSGKQLDLYTAKYGKYGLFPGKLVAGAQRATDQVNGIASATGEQAQESMVIRKAMDRISEMVGQIANATREQASGSELIMAAVERMKRLTGQVHNSTREQSKTGSFIASSTENITDMIRQIIDACDEQTQESEKIVSAVEDIRHSTEGNLEAARVMDEAASSLSSQIGVLQTEMSGFKIEGDHVSQA